MSSMIRNLQRRMAKKATGYEPKDRPHRDLPDGGYAFVHPTKGFRVISGARLVAQGRMYQLLHHQKIVRN